MRKNYTKERKGINKVRLFYKIHKWFAIIGTLPILAWCLSGLMHPLMSNFFPTKTPNRSYPKKEISIENHQSLQAVLRQNKVDSIRNARLVSFENQNFYQVKNTQGEVQYFEVKSGKELLSGEIQYAEHLARYFLKDSASDVLSIEKIEAFTDQYISINRLLPVYKVSFDRGDKMDIYVETIADRLATSIDTKRAVYQSFFRNFHTWTFAGTYNPWRIYSIASVCILMALVGFFGVLIYGFAWKSFKKMTAKTGKQKNRKNHRQWGLALSVFIFSYAITGAYHAFMKTTPDDRYAFFDKGHIPTEKLNQDVLALSQKNKAHNFSVIKLQEENYFQVYKKEGKRNKVLSFNANSGQAEKNITEAYVQDLALSFKGEASEIKKTAFVPWFNRSYGFINKRIPVYEVQFGDEKNSSYFIESSTGHLAAKVDDSMRTEGFSFIMFHKLHLVDFMGKKMRDILASLSVLLIIYVCVTGMRTLFKH